MASMTSTCLAAAAAASTGAWLDVLEGHLAAAAPGSGGTGVHYDAWLLHWPVTRMQTAHRHPCLLRLPLADTDAVCDCSRQRAAACCCASRAGQGPVWRLGASRAAAADRLSAAVAAICVAARACTCLCGCCTARCIKCACCSARCLCMQRRSCWRRCQAQLHPGRSASRRSRRSRHRARAAAQAAAACWVLPLRRRCRLQQPQPLLLRSLTATLVAFLTACGASSRRLRRCAGLQQQQQRGYAIPDVHAHVHCQLAVAHASTTVCLHRPSLPPPGRAVRG